nr:MAG TPA: hypothetical protein [Caudoviricetes sp.]
MHRQTRSSFAVDISYKDTLPSLISLAKFF